MKQFPVPFIEMQSPILRIQYGEETNVPEIGLEELTRVLTRTSIDLIKRHSIRL